MKTAIKLFLMSHGIPLGIKTPDAMAFYQRVARLHGYRLVHRGTGYIIN